MILDKIKKPNDIHKIPLAEFPQLAEEIRSFLIESVSRTGGHLASNLGVVELTLALHNVLDFPDDKLIWDVGHQAYTHKILTGRKGEFETLRKEGGLSGFPKRGESNCDSFDAGHSSDSISAGLGYVHARDLLGENYQENLEEALNKCVDAYDVTVSNQEPAELTGGNLTYIHKVIDGQETYFFANSSNQRVSADVALRGEWKNLYLWDPHTGTRERAKTTVKDGVTSVKLELDSVKSVFFVNEDSSIHSYEQEWTIDKEASCTEKGSKSHHCIYCDEIADVTDIPMKAHSYDVGIVNKKPTAEETGLLVRTCTVCGNTMTEVLPKLQNPKPEPEPAPSLKLNKTSLTLYTKVQKSAKLEATVKGLAGKVAWRSSKKSVATVSSTGKVLAKKTGTTYITAKIGNLKATCKVTVKKPSLKLKKSYTALKIGKKIQIKAQIKPKAKLTYKSSNKKIATVSKNGMVKAKRKGRAFITVKGNGLKKTFRVKVK